MKRETSLPLPPTDIVAVVVSTAAVFFGLAFGGKVLEGYRLQRHNAMLLAEIKALEVQHEQLGGHLEEVKTPAYVERVAREQYRWVKAGESLVVTILRHKSDTESAPDRPADVAVQNNDHEAGSFLGAWWNLLLGRD